MQSFSEPPGAPSLAHSSSGPILNIGFINIIALSPAMLPPFHRIGCIHRDFTMLISCNQRFYEHRYHRTIDFYGIHSTASNEGPKGRQYQRAQPWGDLGLQPKEAEAGLTTQYNQN